MSRAVQIIAFLAIGAGLAVKTPMWPLHTWLPDAHTEAPTVGSVLLAGVLLKMGTYGFARIAIPVLPDGAAAVAPWLGALAVVGIVYGSLACLAQRDLKRMIAYSSIGHMGFVLLGFATLTPVGVNAALFGNIAHGLITGLLFFVAGAVKERYGTADMPTLGGGLLLRLPHLGSVLTFACVASLGLPGLAGFWGEMLALLGAFEPAPGLSRPLFLTFMAVGGLGTVLTAAYFLMMLSRVTHGRPTETVHAPVLAGPGGSTGGGITLSEGTGGGTGPGGSTDEGPGPGDGGGGGGGIRDVRAYEVAAWTPLIGLILLFGLWPKALLLITDPVVRTFVGPVIQSIDHYAIAPPLILALTAGLVLLLDAFLPRRPYSRPLLGAVTMAGVLGALGVVVTQALRTGAPLRTFCVPEGLAGPSQSGLIPSGPVGGGSPVGDMPAVAGGPSCSFVVDGFTLVFAGLALAAGVVVVLLSMAEISSGTDVPAGEWHFLLLCVLTGAVALPAARDLVMLVVALELVSLPVFALTALRRYDGRASEAAVKLFLVSVVSTAVMLFGVSLLYGVTGTVHLDRMAHALRRYTPWSGAAPAPVEENGQAYASSLQIFYDLPPVLTVAMVLVLAGFAFKVAAVPFHAWAADVYQGAPVPVAALLSVISKAAGFAGLILILVAALPAQAAVWAPIIAIVAALTMTAGNLLALRQRHAVRLLAWSSVAQSGYILAPLGVQTREAANASIAYLVFYAAMNLGAFAVVMLVSRRDGQEGIDGYRGLAFRSPVAGLSLVFFLICLAGLPPGLAGLFAKIVVFREIVDGGGAWLVAVMAVNTVIGLYYYVTWAARILTPAAARVPAADGTGTTTEPPGAATRTSGAERAPDAVSGTPDENRAASDETGGAPGSRAGWLPVGVAIVLSGIAAVAFSAAPQAVLDLVPGFLLASR